MLRKGTMLPNFDENTHPTNWFEDIYKNSDIEGSGVPWANMQIHPYFRDWLKENELTGEGKKALVPGCGLGDDCIELESRGFEVTAFDVSLSAIELAQKRFPQCKTTFLEADLFNPPKQWNQSFDFVLEVFTIQSLPPQYEQEIIKTIASFVAPQGKILIIAGVKNEPRNITDGPPWLLTDNYLEHFKNAGLTLDNCERRKAIWGGRDISVSTFIRF